MAKQTTRKKFFSTLSLTNPHLHEPLMYELDNSCSEMGNHKHVDTTGEYRNPIMPFLRYNAEPGEKVSLYLIACIGDAVNGKMQIAGGSGRMEEWDAKDLVEKQKERYLQEVEEAKKEIQFEYELEVIYVEGTKNSSQLKLLQDIVSKVDDDDIVFMDITYGIRPIIISQFLALTYSYKVRRGVTIGALSYGEKYGSLEPRIYNLNEFFLFNQTINNLGDLATPGPLVDRILHNLIEGDDEDA